MIDLCLEKLRTVLFQVSHEFRDLVGFGDVKFRPLNFELEKIHICKFVFPRQFFHAMVKCHARIGCFEFIALFGQICNLRIERIHLLREFFDVGEFCIFRLINFFLQIGFFCFKLFQLLLQLCRLAVIAFRLDIAFRKLFFRVGEFFSLTDLFQDFRNFHSFPFPLWLICL